MKKEKSVILPECESTDKLVDKFNSYFVDKIKPIRNELGSDNPTSVLNEPAAKDQLQCFREIPPDTVYKYIKTASSATCGLDPLPTWILKCCLDTLNPVITKIVNLSLTSGIFPERLKSVIITLVIKISHLDKNELKSYRPVSNIPFLSKIIEKAAIEQISNHMTENDMHEPFQSAYRKNFSTETALLRITNDILMDIDRRRGVILVLLDLSAAFDTIDHTILAQRFEHRIGIKDTALSWIQSYHSDRIQRVSIGGIMSDAVVLECGGPQGSLMGAEDYKAYTLPVGDIIRKHNLRFKIYADDTQIKISFDVKDKCDITVSIGLISECVADIKSWMTANMLKLNADKTEVMFITAPQYSAEMDICSIDIGGADVMPVKSARNIGVIFDDTLSFSAHITAVCRQCLYHIRNIAMIRKYISKEACESLIHAMITSRIDYANSVLAGVPQSELSRLQRIQNMAAKVIFQKRRYDHVTPLMMELHWLPIKERIDFKLLMFTHKAIFGEAPGYIKELVTLYVPPRRLRSMDNPNLLVVPRYRTERYGARAFSSVAPRLWNALPPSIRTEQNFEVFKKLIKTHYFKAVYDL